MRKITRKVKSYEMFALLTKKENMKGVVIEHFEECANRSGYSLVSKPQAREGTQEDTYYCYGRVVYIGKRKCKKVCYYLPTQSAIYFES